MTVQEVVTAVTRLAIALEQSGYWEEFACGLLARAALSTDTRDRDCCLAIATEILGEEGE